MGSGAHEFAHGPLSAGDTTGSAGFMGCRDSMGRAPEGNSRTRVLWRREQRGEVFSHVLVQEQRSHCFRKSNNGEGRLPPWRACATYEDTLNHDSLKHRARASHRSALLTDAICLVPWRPLERRHSDARAGQGQG